MFLPIELRCAKKNCASPSNEVDQFIKRKKMLNVRGGSKETSLRVPKHRVIVKWLTA